MSDKVTQIASDISVIICAYTEERWDDLVAAAASVKRQTISPREIIVVIDHNPNLLKRVREYISDVVAVENTKSRGLRGARSCGVAVAQGQIIAFLDDDAVALPDWLKFLCEGYADPKVMGTGGEIIPLWVADKPVWFPEEFYWVVGCSYRGMLQTGTRIRNPIGANMSLRREVFDIVGDFHSEAKHIGSRHAGGCEETELCIRAQQYWPHHIFLYQAQARVFHRVTDQRCHWYYFCLRCYNEGLAKAELARYIGARDSLTSERTYTFRVLPRGVIRGVADTLFRRDLAGLARGGAIVAGFTMTAVGYLMGNVVSQVMGVKNDLAPEKELCDSSKMSLPVKAQR